MNEEIRSEDESIERQVEQNIAAAEGSAVPIDNKISGSDMAVMTIIIIIAIAVIAASVFTNMLNPQTGTAQPASSAQVQTSRFEVSEYSQLPDGIAAVVNGVEIPESRLNNYVEYFRNVMGLEDDEDWAAFVNQGYGNTEGVRSFVLELFMNQELVRQAAAASGIVITDEEVDEAIADDMASNQIEDEDVYWNLIANSGLSTDEYKSILENQILQNKIIEMVNPESSYEDELDDRILTYIKENYPARANIESLDEVGDEVKENAKEYVVYYLNLEKYNEFMDKYMDMSDIEVAAAPGSLPYEADTGLLQLQDLAKKIMTQMELAQQDSKAQQIQAE